MTPLLDAGLTKAQVRAASRAWGLPTWDKPAAACLSSRIAYGVEITPHRLARVERAEAAVRAAPAGGTRATCGCATSATRARVEVDRDLGRPALRRGDAGRRARRRASPRRRSTRWGFRSGAMNELLDDPDRFR